MSKRMSLGDFFHNLTGGKAGAPPTEEQSPEMTPPVEEEGVEAARDDAMCLPEVKGPLMEVWHRWTGDYSPPTLSLATGKTPEELHMDDRAVERERMRLTLQMEKDAKKRLQEIEQAEKKGVKSLNALCQIYLSRDKMVAWSFIFPPVGPEGKMQGESVGRALERSGVTTGIDSGAMVAIFQEPLYFKLLPIAIGTPPVQGTDGSVTERFPREISKEVKIDENGSADYFAGNYVQLVEKDTVICDILPPQPGSAGLQVDGKVVEPKPVRAAKIPSGANTKVTEDGLHLVSTLAGHLEFSHGAFQVRPLLEIQGDIDYAIGNIDFIGDVHVHGDVRENFVVRASGTIMVDGLVEAATVEAGGDLVITRGVVGDNRALLKSGGCVRVKFLENCVVYAGKWVYADCIMNSQIFSDGSISVTSGRGSVVGGALTAAHSIEACMIGAQSGRRTELTLGVLPYVQNELNDIQEDLKRVEAEKSNLDKELVYLENGYGLEGSSEKLAKARMRRSVLGMKEIQLQKRRERLEPMAPDLSKCFMKCDVVYPVTTLTVQDANWTARQVRRYCKVAYDIKTEKLKEIM